ncbi:unnamed protein product [Penicillium nalgiovense]|uniref:Chitin-binding type-1 domain-containing protein n=1 Tax=Penicillium nalgiovense TaxID=60175 RepID=A0A9W4II31_PENNA|nr:unnamed protein product [Penicillium nalgiovense]CAG7974003.1 unnamed protein product [Penicillium nalgiovense]CAG7974445.1 unnamed protein product [Penicillium nalgiovense]CAG7979619.1 unnamed protein product [Penicillium nalgiovense]CAG7983838.1 unnamed protein product [Penicillium nalgiovense]
MSHSSCALLALAALSSLSSAKEVGYFDSSSCADPKGFATCYENADTTYSNCVNNNCAGGGESCYNSCGGSTSCMNEQCPGLGVDCINACECERSALQIDCAGQSCWNKVYSCEYQATALDYISFCLNPDRDGLPYWPTPDDVPDSCSCNTGQIEQKLYLINNQMNTCSNNQTNIGQVMTNVDAITEYAQACICCSFSAIISAYDPTPELKEHFFTFLLLMMLFSIWGTCPDTQPSLLAADEWFVGLLNPGHWEDCGPYLEKYDCAGDLGFGRADAGGITKFYSPGNLPANGTKSLYNLDGVVSTPVSGDVFTWTFASSLVHTVTVSSADATATGAKASGGNDVTATGTGTSTATGTAESDVKSGVGSSLRVPSWTIASIFGILALSTL